MTTQITATHSAHDVFTFLATRPVHLSLKLLHPGSPPSHAGELVRLRGLEIEGGLRAFASGLRAFADRFRAIRRCPHPIACGSSPILGGLHSVARGAGSITRALALELELDFVPVARHFVEHLGCGIPQEGRPVALECRSIAFVSACLP